MTDPDRRLQIEAYESIYCYRTRLFVERQGFAATGDIAVRRRVFRAVGPTAKFRRWKTPIGGCARRRKGCRLVWFAGAKVITSSCILRRVGTAMGPTCRPRISQTRDRLDGQASMADHIRPRRRVPLCGPLTILRTDRLSGLHNRLLALKCLTLVRLYRASLIFCLALHRDTARLLGTGKGGSPEVDI